MCAKHGVISIALSMLALVCISDLLAQVPLIGNEIKASSHHPANHNGRAITDFPNTPITSDEGNSVDPAIDCDNDFCYLVWEDNRDGNWEIYFAVTAFDGVKLFSEINISNSSSNSYNPDVSVDSAGHAFVTWTEGGDLGNLMIAVLDNNGGMILNPLIYASPNCRNPELAAFGNGSCNIIYEKANIIMDYKLYWERFDIAGSRLCGPVTLSNWELFDFVKNPSLACYPDGESWMTWHDINNFQEGVYTARRLADCSSGGSELPYGISNDVGYPSITLSPEFYWLNFEDILNGGYIIRNYRSPNNACQIAPQGLSGSARYPSTGTDNSEGYVAWEYQDAAFAVYLTKFYGCEIRSQEEISDGSGNARSPDLYVRKNNSGEYFVAWQDDRNGDWDIYFSTSVVSSSITGTVYDADSEMPIREAKVDLLQDDIIINTEYTNTNGDYIFQNISPGTYDLYFSMAGYEDYQISDFSAIEGLNIVDDVFLSLEPLTIRLVYGSDQGENAGLPVSYAYAKIYRNNELLEMEGPTDETGVLILSSLEAGDEIYTSRIIGAGRTNKGNHPEIPDYIMPEDIPPDCTLPWRAFYYVYLDNQKVDEDDSLVKSYFDGSLRTIQLNHKIAKLNMVITFDHPISSSDYYEVSNQIDEQIDKLNRFLFNASNGILLIDSVYVTSSINPQAGFDLKIMRQPLGRGKKGHTLTHEEFDFPMFMYNQGFMISDRNNYAKSGFYQTLAHELGHYFFNLGDETAWSPCGPFNCIEFCNWGFLTYHSSIMSDWVSDALGIEEFCYLNHNPDQSLVQNIFHQSKSCWEYLVEDWNDFESYLSEIDICPVYLVADKIDWELPAGNYQEGPYIPYPQTTSQKAKIDKLNLIPSVTAINIDLLVSFWPGLKGVNVFLIDNTNTSLTSGINDIEEIEYMGYHDKAFADSIFKIYSVELNQEVLITSDSMVPIFISPDTVTHEITIMPEPLDSDDTFTEYIIASPGASGDEISFSIKSTRALPSPPKIILSQGEFASNSLEMSQISESIYESVVTLDPLLPMIGSYIIFHDSLSQLYVGRWEMSSAFPNLYERIEFLNDYAVLVDSLAFSDSIFVLLTSCPVPSWVGSYQNDRLFPSSPIYISFSNGDAMNNGLYLAIYAGEYFINDTTITISKANLDTENVEHFSTVLSRLDFYASTNIAGGGLYMLTSNKPEIGFTYLAGDANMFNETVDLGNPLSGPWRVGGDVTFLVNYFDISSGNQPCLMYNPYAPDEGQISGGYFFASGDATGDCQVLGGDVSRLVQYFAGNPAGIVRWCGWDKPDPQSYYQPLWLSNRGSGGDQPVPPLEELPPGWPNCEEPPAGARVIPYNSLSK